MGNPRSLKNTKSSKQDGCKTVGRRRGAKLAKGFDDLRALIPCYPPEKKLTKIETLRLAILYIKDLSDIVGTSAMTASADISLNKSTSSICSSGSSDCSKSTCSTLGVDRDSVDCESVISQSSAPGSPPQTDTSANNRHIQALPSAFFTGGSPSINAGLLSGKGALSSPYYRSIHPSVSPFTGGRANTRLYGMQETAGDDEALSAHQFLSFLQHQALMSSHFGAEPSPVPISPLPLPFSSFDYMGPCGVFA